MAQLMRGLLDLQFSALALRIGPIGFRAAPPVRSDNIV